MYAQPGDAPSRFAERVVRLLERVEHRRAQTDSEREAIYRLRYEAYLREGFINQDAEARLFDPSYDESPNCWNVGTFIDGELAGTVRIHVATSENDVLPFVDIFPDVIDPLFKSGKVIVFPTRFATKLEFSRQFAEMPYLTVRPGWMAGEHFGADNILATMRVEHQAFYRRVFGYEPLGGAREHPRLTRKIACMGFDYRAQQERVEKRYPFFRSSAAERLRLFGDLADAWGRMSVPVNASHGVRA
jgi:hypothetical protein